MFEKFFGFVMLICIGLIFAAVVEANGYSFETGRIMFIAIFIFVSLYFIFTKSQTHQDIAIYPEEIIKHKAFKLSNDSCQVQYLYDEKKIICFNNYYNENNEKEYVISTLEDKEQQYMDDVWFLIFQFFSDDITYENISNTLYKSGLKTETFYLKGEKIKTEFGENLLNINSATEKEIAALPGINIIMAKKAIKHICENNGFKSVDEFFKILKIKEPFKTTLKNIICVLPVKSTTKNNESPQNNGRSVDL